MGCVVVELVVVAVGCHLVTGTLFEFPSTAHAACCFEPVSTTTQGRHMIMILNQLGVQCSVLGNHDLGTSLLVCRGRDACNHRRKVCFPASSCWPALPR